MKSEIVCVIDRSGSMMNIKNDAIGGFNTFLEEQKKIEGEATLTYIQFDNEYEVVHENKPLQDVPSLTEATYIPRGMTALHDAVGKTIDDVGKRLNSVKILPKGVLPDKVIFCILTDGHENASKNYTREKVKEMIEHQRTKYSWEFIFLAANQDAFAVGSQMGIADFDTFNFVLNSAGVKKSLF